MVHDDTDSERHGDSASASRALAKSFKTESNSMGIKKRQRMDKKTSRSPSDPHGHVGTERSQKRRNERKTVYDKKGAGASVHGPGLKAAKHLGGGHGIAEKLYSKKTKKFKGIVCWQSIPRGVLGRVYQDLGFSGFVLGLVCRKWERSFRKILQSSSRWLQRALSRDLSEMTASLDAMVKERRAWQMAVINATRSCIACLWPGARVEVFGSFATSLCAPSSDIDLVVCDVVSHYESVMTKSQPRNSTLLILAEHLRSQPWVFTVVAVESTAVPIIKVKAAFEELGTSGVNMDISFDSPSHRGLVTCAFVKGLVAEYPTLPPLVLILKQFLVMKGLNDPYTGGLSSYGLVLMIVSVLQRDKGGNRDQGESILCWSSATMSPADLAATELGRLFITFLDIFGRRFSPREHGISVRDGGCEIMRSALKGTDNPSIVQILSCIHPLSATIIFTRQTQTNLYEHILRPGPFVMDPLVLVDPFDPSSNVGRGCFGISQVQHAFAGALKSIEGSFFQKIGSQDHINNILGGVFSTIHHSKVVSFARQLWLPPSKVKRRIYYPQAPTSLSTRPSTSTNKLEYRNTGSSPSWSNRGQRWSPNQWNHDTDNSPAKKEDEVVAHALSHRPSFSGEGSLGTHAGSMLSIQSREGSHGMPNCLAGS